MGGYTILGGGGGEFHCTFFFFNVQASCRWRRWWTGGEVGTLVSCCSLGAAAVFILARFG